VSAVFALGFSAGSSQGMDDAYFAKFRYVILVDNGAHSVFMEKNQLDDPPRSGPGAVSVETNGAGAGKGWGWIAWQAARDLEIRHFNCCAAGIHVIALDAFVDAQTEASSANAAEPCEGPVSLRQRCVERFDLYAHTAAEAQRFFAWVALLPLGTVVAVCISSTAMAKRRPLPQCVYDAFAKLGAPETLSLIGYQNPFAFVGFKGASRGQGTFNILREEAVEGAASLGRHLCGQAGPRAAERRARDESQLARAAFGFLRRGFLLSAFCFRLFAARRRRGRRRGPTREYRRRRRCKDWCRSRCMTGRGRSIRSISGLRPRYSRRRSR